MAAPQGGSVKATGSYFFDGAPKRGHFPWPVTGVLFHADIFRLFFSQHILSEDKALYIYSSGSPRASLTHLVSPAKPPSQPQVMASSVRLETLMGQPVAIGRPLLPWEFWYPRLSWSLHFESQHFHSQLLPLEKICIHLPCSSSPYHTQLSALLCHSKFTWKAHSF